MTEGQKKLVRFYGDCQRWDKVIRSLQTAQSGKTGPFYIVLKWFDEGYTGERPVYRVVEEDIANELLKAVCPRFSTDPQEAFESGASSSFEIVEAGEAASRVVWDADLRKLHEAVRSGSRDGDARITAACLEWEQIIRQQSSDGSAATPQRSPDANVASEGIKNNPVKDIAIEPKEARARTIDVLKNLADFLGNPFHRFGNIVEAFVKGDETFSELLKLQYERAKRLDDVCELIVDVVKLLPVTERQIVIEALAAGKSECIVVRDMLQKAFDRELSEQDYLVRCDTDLSRTKSAEGKVLDAIDHLAAAAFAEKVGGVQELINSATGPDPSMVIHAVTIFDDGIEGFARQVMDTNDRSDYRELYAPLEKAGYTILPAARTWEVPAPVFRNYLKSAANRAFCVPTICQHMRIMMRRARAR